MTKPGTGTLLFAALSILMLSAPAAGAPKPKPPKDPKVPNSIKAFGTIDNCSPGPSMDGNFAVLGDDNDGMIYYYNFQTRRKFATGETGRFASIRGNLIAIHDAGTFKIYDITTGQVSPTGVAAFEPWEAPWKFFDGNRIVYIDSADRYIKLYDLATGAVTSTGIEAVNWTDYSSIDGNYMTYNYRDPATSVDKVALYNISTGTSLDIDSGFGSVVRGDVVSYIGGTGNRGELRIYRISTGAITFTGLHNISIQSTDGAAVVANVYNSSIRVYDIATGVITDTGIWACSGGDACHIDISGDYIGTEQYEGGTDDYTTSPKTVIYPPRDINGDGTVDWCAAVWFKWR